MDHAEREADFTAYVRAREQVLARLVYLLTGERDAAEDLLQNTLAKGVLPLGSDPRGRGARRVSAPDHGQREQLPCRGGRCSWEGFALGSAPQACGRQEARGHEDT
jgi:hypothetical protein